MRSYSLIILVCLSVLGALAFSSCASLGSKSDDAALNDPIEAAAAVFRRPSATTDQLQTEAAAQERPSYLPAPENIELGMSMREVGEVWGEPRDIESAGDPRDGNQRWIYFAGLSSRFGLGSKRVVYFENGKVAGWKNSP